MPVFRWAVVAAPFACHAVRWRLLPAGLAAGLLVACSSTPPAKPPPAGPATPARPRPALPPAPGADGPEANPPPGLLQVPDAEPRLELVRPGGPNKPYEVLGQGYVPASGDPVLVERGLASWYGRKFHGRQTASGETYDMYAMTAAHRTMPIPSYARVRNPANGREVVVRINDRGPFHAERIVDLSYTAALKLGVLGGVARVELERITYEAIRTGSWRRPGGTADTGLAAAPRPEEGGSADPIADIARRAAAGPLVAGPAAPMPDSAAPGPGPGAPVAASADGPAAASASLPGGGAGALVATGVPARAPTAAARGFWLQLGAFRQATGASELLRQLQREADWLAPLLTVFHERPLHRLQAGPFASREDADAAARRVRPQLPAAASVIERR